MRFLTISTLLAVLFAIFVPIIADGNIYVYSVFTIIFVNVMFGQAWNILGGFAGQISFGHAMFFGIGAYVGMIIVMNTELDMFVALIVGGLVSGLFSLGVGALIFRLTGPYFGLSTLAIAEMVRIVAMNWKSVTNGGEGIMMTKKLEFLGAQVSTKQEYFFLALGLAFIVTLFCYFLTRSKVGYGFIAIRENQDAAEAMGLNTNLYKAYALFSSAFLAGLTGAFFGFYNKFLDPHMVFEVHTSVSMIFVTVIGGIGTVIGPFIGAFVVVGLEEGLKGMDILRSFPSLYLIIYGALIMAVILYLPGGLVDGFKRIFDFISSKVMKEERK